MGGGGAFVKPSPGSAIRKDHLRGPPWGLGSLPLAHTGILSEAGLGEGSLALAPRSRWSLPP